MPTSPASLPNSLLERLALDNRRIDTTLTRSTVDEATPLVRESAQRRLLSLTDRALTGVEDIMQNGQPKERLAASLAILDRSPATEQKKAGLEAGVTLPAAAVEALIQGLGNLFQAIPKSPAATPVDFQDVTAHFEGDTE